ncbi:MAG: metallophosphoesterase [Leptolyngbya foveolarum]|uniref:Metallophosphoesterase n=1 Tax=Leptolyngbya foveolarum TaxID=47253 RepID=A0A2W4UJ97_9CYAN|nr:MAG: metallophosphoesterase [Leptolyngbya foveolarum]
MFNPNSASVVDQSAASMLSHQVQWQYPRVVQGGVDQTRLVISDGVSDQGPGIPFSFMVMGDTDAGELGTDLDDSFSTLFAQQMMNQAKESRFWLHTGDMTYPLGTYQNYWSGFLRPYSALLASSSAQAPSGARNARRLARSSAVVFNRPVLPVPGNHDYGRLPFWSNCRQRLLQFWCDRLRQLTGIDWGHYGGQGGEAYGQLFLDDLSKFSAEQLKHHLINHYNAPLLEQNEGAAKLTYGLDYAPGRFTRLPNRYYRFHYGGVDFFALDSNTWKSSPEAAGFDQAQLDWLEQGLVDSWRSPNSVGRIVYLHHSPYTTESSRWQQPETLWVRRHLRRVLDNVKTTLAPDMGEYFSDSSSLVDLVISGHAHCLEHIKTGPTGQGDANLNWLVCGGSGVSLRRQRQTGRDILETLTVAGRQVTEVVAQSQLYAGVHGHHAKKQHFHSFVQIDVHPKAKSGLVVRPFVVVKGRTGWQTKALGEIPVGGSFLGHARHSRDRCSKKTTDSDPSVASFRFERN